MNKFFCLVLILFSVFQLKNINIGTDYRLFFGENNEDLASFIRMEKQFGKNDTILLALAPKDKIIFSKKMLKIIEEITELFYQVPHSKRVDSVTNFLNIESKQDEVVIDHIFDSKRHQLSSDLASIKKKVLDSDQLVGKLINKKGTVTGINITVHIPNDQPNAVLSSADYMKKKVSELELKYPEVDFYLSGIIIMNDAFATYMIKDLLSLTPLSNIIIFLLIAYFFKSFYVAAIVMFISILSNITGLGFAGLTNIKLTPPSGMSTIVILTISIADCIHILTSISKYDGESISWKDKIRYSLKKNFRSIFLTSVTTAIGFLCLNFSDAPPYHDLGNISAVGVLAALIYSLVLFPYLLSLKELNLKFVFGAKITSLGRFISSYRKAILFTSIIISCVFIFLSSKIVINDTFVNWFSENTKFRKNIDYVNKNLTGLYTFEFELKSSKNSSVFDPNYLKDLEKFQVWWMANSKVWHVESLVNIMKDLNKAFNANDIGFYSLPKEQNLAAQLFLFYEMGLPQGFDINNRVTLDKTSSRMTVSFKNLDSKMAERLTDESHSWLKENTTHIVPVKAQGPSIMFSNISRRNIESMFTGTVIAFFLITLIMIFSLKSIKLGLISILPNVIPFVITFGVWQLLYKEVGLAISIVTSATLGIIIDDTIHIMSAYSREIQSGQDESEALSTTLQTSGVASLTTSIVLIFGFSVMLFSDFLINFTFGLLAILSIVIAIGFDLIILPAILITFIHKEKS